MNFLALWRTEQFRTKRLKGEFLRRPTVSAFVYLLDRNPVTLSGGELQRLGISVATVTNPKLMVLEEPFGELDANNALSVLERFLIVDLPLLGIATCVVGSGYCESMIDCADVYALDGSDLWELGANPKNRLKNLRFPYPLRQRRACSVGV